MPLFAPGATMGEGIDVIPAVDVKRILQDRRPHDVAYLVLVHPRLQPVHHLLIDDVALLDVDAVDEGQFEGALGTAGRRQQHGQEEWKKSY